ncbi:MAG: hypothetical protein EB084_26235 [Proteobacteria bacterium]|nr:hypothetical protein [Pseudomonadota bacterium]
MPPGWQPTYEVESSIPWETVGSPLLTRWWKTVTATFKGRAFFAALAQSDDAMSAVTFHTLTLALVGFAYGGLYMLMMAVLGTIVVGPLGAPSGLGLLAAGGMWGVGLASWLSMTLLGAATGFAMPWALAGVHHLVLALTGGVPPDRSYTHTVRAHAYANAGAMAFAAVPYVGSLIALVFGIKNHLEAYDELHRCGGGKALLAYFTPFFCSCCGIGAFLAIFSSLAFAAF